MYDYEVRKLKKPDPETLSGPQCTSIVFGAERSNQVDSWPFKSGNTNLFYNFTILLPLIGQHTDQPIFLQ